MTPTLSLGPFDSPSIEFVPRDIEPLVILLMEQNAPLTNDTLACVWTFIQLDSLHLREGSEGFFLKLENTCRRVVEGELTWFDVTKIRGSEFDGYLHRHLGDGSVTASVKIAAQRFLDFLAANPGYLPQ